MKLKRREMLVAAVGVATAQQTPAQPTDLVELARQSMKANREAIAKVKMDIAVEPAFVFKA